MNPVDGKESYFTGPVVRDYLAELRAVGSSVDPRSKYDIAQLSDSVRQRTIGCWAIERAITEARKRDQDESAVYVFTRVIKDEKKEIYKLTVDPSNEGELTWLQNKADSLRSTANPLDILNSMVKAK